MKRRHFLAFAAAAPALQGAPATTLGKMTLGKIPTRKVGKVETVFTLLTQRLSDLDRFIVNPPSSEM